MQRLIKFTIVTLVLFVALLGSGWPAASAAPDPTTGTSGAGSTADPCYPERSGGGTKLSDRELSKCLVCHPESNGGTALTKDQLASCEACTKAGLPTGDISQACLQKNPIVKQLNIFVNFLSGLVGVVVVGVIIVGGIQYSLAGGNPQAVAAARKRIIDGLIALFAFLFIFAFVQWLVPGGVF